MIRAAVAAAAMGMAVASCSPSPQTKGEKPAAEKTRVSQAAVAPAAFGQCAACHSVEPGVRKTGPGLAGVVGRQAGTESGFAYSRPMRESGIVWTPEALDRFIEKPQSVLPGNRMTTSVSDPVKRTQIIAYLGSAVGEGAD